MMVPMQKLCKMRIMHDDIMHYKKVNCIDFDSNCHQLKVISKQLHLCMLFLCTASPLLAYQMMGPLQWPQFLLLCILRHFESGSGPI